MSGNREYYRNILDTFSTIDKHSILRKIGRGLNWLGNILAILTPLIIFKVASGDKDIVSLTAVIVLGVLALMFAILLLTEEWRLSQKARYSEAMRSLHLSVHILRDIAFNLDNTNITDEKRCEDISLSLEALAKTFCLLKAVHCRVCIKKIGLNDQVRKEDLLTLSEEEKLRSLYVYTFERNHETNITRNCNEYGKPEEHTIGGNTDFRKLFLMKRGERSWLCNDIWSCKSYQNTKLAFVEDIRDLGYRSVLVVPIRKTTEGKILEKQYAEDQDVRGFVCVDSMTRGIFDGRYDADVTSIYADALYMLMKQWFQSKA